MKSPNNFPSTTNFKKIFDGIILVVKVAKISALIWCYFETVFTNIEKNWSLAFHFQFEKVSLKKIIHQFFLFAQMQHRFNLWPYFFVVCNKGVLTFFCSKFVRFIGMLNFTFIVVDFLCYDIVRIIWHRINYNSCDFFHNKITVMIFFSQIWLITCEIALTLPLAELEGKPDNNPLFLVILWHWS